MALDPQVQIWLDSLPPEERERYLAESELMPVVEESQINDVIDVARAGENRKGAQARLERALVGQGAASSDLMAAVGQPKGVPSPYGTILMKETPIMQLVKGLRAWKAGQNVATAEGDEGAAMERQMQGKGAYERAKRGQALTVRERALAEAMRKAKAREEADRLAEADVERRLVEEGY
jgi:hypothetical protein